MTIRKTFMSMVPLSSLVVLALAAVPARADDKFTSEGVTFTVTFAGSDHNNFDIQAFNPGDTEKECDVWLTLKTSSGKDVEVKWDKPFKWLASPRSVQGAVGNGHADVPKEETPLAPTLTAKCTVKK